MNIVKYILINIGHVFAGFSVIEMPEDPLFQWHQEYTQNTFYLVFRCFIVVIGII